MLADAISKVQVGTTDSNLIRGSCDDEDEDTNKNKRIHDVIVRLGEHSKPLRNWTFTISTYL